MIYPTLVPRALCKTKVKVRIEPEGVDNNGEPFPSTIWEGNCNYQDSATTIYKDGKKIDTVMGICLIPGDIAPDMPDITCGEVIINGMLRYISRGTKARNPDGTVNFTKIEVR